MLNTCSGCRLREFPLHPLSSVCCNGSQNSIRYGKDIRCILESCRCSSLVPEQLALSCCAQQHLQTGSAFCHNTLDSIRKLLAMNYNPLSCIQLLDEGQPLAWTLPQLRLFLTDHFVYSDCSQALHAKKYRVKSMKQHATVPCLVRVSIVY